MLWDRARHHLSVLRRLAFEVMKPPGSVGRDSQEMTLLSTQAIAAAVFVSGTQGDQKTVSGALGLGVLCVS